MKNNNIQISNNKLQRVLSLRDIVIYGIILIQPVAALPLFGHVNYISKGHAVTTIFIAMVAMIFTAISYGRMASVYPQAGSAYTYVGRSINLNFGFIVGWSMILDYLFIPILTIIFSSISAHHILPFIHQKVWVFLIASGLILINLRGIRMASRTNLLLMLFMTVVVFYFMIEAARYILIKNGVTGLFSISPFYKPETFSLKSIGPATALAALTYIGFDGITTLSEEVKNPKKNILLAAIITCILTGIFSGMQIYLAQLAIPDWQSLSKGFTDINAINNALDTSILTVANLVGGSILDSSLSFILLLGSFGSGLAGLLGASRLLYGIGRDGILPRKIFGHLDKKHASPNYNILIIGVIAMIGAYTLSFEESARLINFGAFLAFMGVNIASLNNFYFKSKKKSIRSFLLNFIPAFLGSLFSLIIWINLPLKTFIIGGIWLLIGIIYLAVNTKGFKKTPKMIDFYD
jgi:amino acid transporter